MPQLLFILSILITLPVFSQQQNSSTKFIDCSSILKAGDIEHAIDVGRVKKIALKCSPKGAGEKNEAASGKAKDIYYFEKEHNVVWIKFKIPLTGNLTFTIRPKNPQNDYDFLLFKSENELSASQIATKKIKPIRSNLSRFNTKKNGITGLSFNATQKHISAGIKDEFSEMLKVAKDEVYYLALDNVYNEGEGAIIEFGYFDLKKITGYVTDESRQKKLDAELSWEDVETGTILKTTKTNPQTGYFEMEVPFITNNPSKTYMLGTGAKEYFFDEKFISVEKLKQIENKPLNIALSQLKKGNRLKINTINFQGNAASFLSSAYPSLERLVTLMKENETLKILVEGHTNGCDDDVQLLSERRALRVKKYLFDNQIDIERVETIGHGCAKMLYPITATEEEQQLNRRVEILILEY